METKPTSSRMYSLLILYDMHTRYFERVLDGLSEDDTHNRLSTKANHIAWLTGSLVHQRFEIANELGVREKPPADELFREGKGIQDDIKYPTLADYKEDWTTITSLLRDAFLQVTDERLDRSFEMMPGVVMPFFDLVTFITYREASVIGQIALWRRLLGYPGMKYD